MIYNLAIFILVIFLIILWQNRANILEKFSDTPKIDSMLMKDNDKIYADQCFDPTPQLSTTQPMTEPPTITTTPPSPQIEDKDIHHHNNYYLIPIDTDDSIKTTFNVYSPVSGIIENIYDDVYVKKSVITIRMSNGQIYAPMSGDVRVTKRGNYIRVFFMDGDGDSLEMNYNVDDGSSEIMHYNNRRVIMHTYMANENAERINIPLFKINKNIKIGSKIDHGMLIGEQERCKKPPKSCCL